MKYIVAIIPPDRLSVILDKLDARDIHLVTVGRVMGLGGCERGTAEVYRGHREIGRLLSKVKLELAVPDAEVDLVTADISASLGGDPTSGDVFVMDLAERVRARPVALGA